MSTVSTPPQIMTRDYAVREGFIAPVDGCLEEERKFPYVRITHWYGPEEAWMARNVIHSLNGCDFIVIVDETSQAVFRSRHQIKTEDEHP